MNKKSLIISSVLSALAITTLLIMFMSILDVKGFEISMFDYIKEMDNWYYIQDYLWGIGALISVVCLPLLIMSTIFCILSACGVIKSKKLDLILYIVNIVLAFLVVCVIVNYFLGLGRTLGMSGLKLFKGTTYFKYASAFFYLHCSLSIAMLVLACLNRKKSK